LNGIHTLRLVTVIWRQQTFSTTKHHQNGRKCWKSSRTHSQRPSLNKPFAHRHRCDQFWRLAGVLGKSEHVPHCHEVSSLTLEKWSEFVTIHNCQISHFYSVLFPKLKTKLKGRHFETVSDIQRDSQAVLNSIKENDFHSSFEAQTKVWDHCIRSQGHYFDGDAR
jgi:hypothetical protein